MTDLPKEITGYCNSCKDYSAFERPKIMETDMPGLPLILYDCRRCHSTLAYITIFNDTNKLLNKEVEASKLEKIE